MSNFDRDHIVRIVDYHHWAADRVLDAFVPVTAEQLDKPWGGSFGTGRALLRHVVGVEWLWLERWQGRSPKSIPEPPPTSSGRDFRADWERIKREQQTFVDDLGGERLALPLSYTNLKGERSAYPLGDLLAHLVNHGTYHRGQLTHLLRDLGMPAPSTDFLLFMAERRKG